MRKSNVKNIIQETFIREKNMKGNYYMETALKEEEKKKKNLKVIMISCVSRMMKETTNLDSRSNKHTNKMTELLNQQ